MSDLKPLVDAVTKMTEQLAELSSPPTVFDALAVNAEELRWAAGTLAEAVRVGGNL